MKKWQEGDYLFDGFAHRPYNELIDGWRNAMPDPEVYECVRQAQSVLDLFEDLQAANRRIWEQEKELERLRPLLKAYL